MVRIEPFLLQDETLLGSCGTGRGIVCATDQRLLRVERTLLGRRIRDLSYREISSVAILDQGNAAVVLSGLILMAAGALLSPLVQMLLPGLGAPRTLRLTAEGAQTLIAATIVLVVLGVALVLLGVLRRRCYIALDGPFLLRDRRQRRHWRFPTPTPSDARVFASLVRGCIAERAPSAERKVLPHDPL